MRIIENKIYFIYILFGLLYFITKLIYYICGFVCLRGLILGLIATVLTICIGILAFREYKKRVKTIAHWLSALFPLIILPTTPIYMICRLGTKAKLFQIEKLSICMIFICLAFVQVILAILMFKNLILGNVKSSMTKSEVFPSP